MIISHKYKFVILGIQKTASRSIQSTYGGLSDIIGVGVSKNKRAVKNHDFYKHSSAARLRIVFAKHGWDWDSYTSAAVVRNPWDRYLSAVNYLDANRKKHRIPEDAGYKDLLYGCIRRWQSQFEFLISPYGDRIVDKLIEFEDLKKGMEGFLGSVGVEDIPELLHENRGSGKVGIKELYNDLDIAEVAHKEWRIIEEIGYSFKDTKS